MSNLVQDLVNQFLSDSVVTTGVVVGSILLASDHLLRMEEAAVSAGTDFVDDVGLEIAVDGSRNIFALACIMISREWDAKGIVMCIYECLPVSEKKVLKP